MTVSPFLHILIQYKGFCRKLQDSNRNICMEFALFLQLSKKDEKKMKKGLQFCAKSVIIFPVVNYLLIQKEVQK